MTLSKFRSHCKFKSILMPRHKNQVDFDPETKTKSFSTPTQKLSQFQSLHRNQVKFNRPHWNKINFDQHKNLAQFDPYTKIKLISTHDGDQVNFDPYSKFKSILMPRHKNQVNFDTTTKIKLIRSPTLKSSQFRHPDTKTKRISIH